MQNKQIAPQENLKNAYAKAYNMAVTELAKKDPSKIAAKTGIIFDKNNNVLRLDYMADIYLVDPENGSIEAPDGSLLTDTAFMTLLLHYLVHDNKDNASPAYPAGKQVAFSEIPGGGAIYNNAYQKRVIIPLAKTFGDEPGLLSAIADKFNGRKESYGDVSAVINVFPFAPVTFVIWRGDDEFAPSATILFDESISTILPVEDIVIMASFAVYRMIKEAKKPSVKAQRPI